MKKKIWTLSGTSLDPFCPPYWGTSSETAPLKIWNNGLKTPGCMVEEGGVSSPCFD